MLRETRTASESLVSVGAKKARLREPMYLLYEHHSSPSGELLGTDMLLSSWFPGRKGINWKDPADAAIFEFSKIIFKDVHIASRNYDPKTNVWSFLGSVGKEVYEKLKGSPIIAVGLKLQKIEDLLAQAETGFISKPSISSWDANDFFYNPQGVVSGSGPSKAEIVLKLSALLAISERELESASIQQLKKPYRLAAKLLHPDFNNGDDKGMRELNMLWQQWQPFLAKGGS
jgi:hypothetical protein